MEFEGSPDEYRESGLQQAILNFRRGSTLPVAVDEPGPGGEAALRDDEGFLRRALELRPLSALLDKTFRLLLDAEPLRFVTRSEIAAELQCTQSQIDGVLGSLGRRVNETPRSDMTTQIGIGVLLDWERSQMGEWSYRLRPSFRNVLQSYYSNR
jgi:hypothetical protein